MLPTQYGTRVFSATDTNLLGFIPQCRTTVYANASGVNAHTNDDNDTALEDGGQDASSDVAPSSQEDASSDVAPLSEEGASSDVATFDKVCQ